MMKSFVLFTALCCAVPMFAQQPQPTMKELREIGLPIVTIETTDGEEPTYEEADPPEGCLGASIKNATKVPGKVVVSDASGTIYDSGKYVAKTSGMTIKIRGNWSARIDKKPYKIKLQKKADMLGRGDKRFNDKNWLLLPCMGMQHYVGLKVNELMQLAWTPRYRYVNVVFNGDYRGLYLLMESVERNQDCRINVSEKGFIMELDAYWWNEDVYLESSFEEPMNYTFKYPETEDLTDGSKTYIHNVLQEAESSMHDGTYEQHIDVESFARWMLARDILGNIDSAGSNIFITKYDQQESSLLKMSCMWDFDTIMKSDEWDSVHYFYYFALLFNSSNRAFVSRYKDIWNSKNAQLKRDLMNYLDEFLTSDLCSQLDASIALDNARWGYEILSSGESINQARDYFTAHWPWLDAAIGELSPSSEDGIFLPSEGEISTEGTGKGYNLYDISGRRLQKTPHQPGIYIRKGKKIITNRVR